MDLQKGTYYILKSHIDPTIQHSCHFAEFMIDKPNQLEAYLRLMAHIKSDPVRYSLHQDTAVDFQDANAVTYTSHQVIWFERTGGEHGD